MSNVSVAGTASVKVDVFIQVTGDDSLSVKFKILQSCFFRLIRLLEEIMSEKENKTIIFVETKRRCDDLTRRMRRDG